MNSIHSFILRLEIRYSDILLSNIDEPSLTLSSTSPNLFPYPFLYKFEATMMKSLYHSFESTSAMILIWSEFFGSRDLKIELTNTKFHWGSCTPVIGCFSFS
jgi:hypothetical protein